LLDGVLSGAEQVDVLGVGVSHMREGCVGEVRVGGAEARLGEDEDEAREEPQGGTADRCYRCCCYPQQPSLPVLLY